MIWEEVSEEFRPLLAMQASRLDLGYLKLFRYMDGNTIIYTGEDLQGNPQTDYHTVLWWTTAVNAYNLFLKVPSEMAKYLNTTNGLVRYMISKMAEDPLWIASQ